ncbi:hypothetical protein C0J52_03581 [Blattella germanica]|nr:hypothetical protein C0J52_03581 [Blattella germanica]
MWLPMREKIQNELRLEAERGFVCEECGKVLRSPITLKRHVLDLHREQTERFWCNVCQKCYRTKNSLVVHLCKYHQKNKAPPTIAPILKRDNQSLFSEQWHPQ